MSWCLSAGGPWLVAAVCLAMIGLAAWALTRLFPAAGKAHTLDALNLRLARGELDAATYRSLRDELAPSSQGREHAR